MESNEELYKFIHELIAKLGSIGENHIAERIRRAMYMSSVGTEVFMALRYELTQFSQTKVNLEKDTLAKLNEAISDIGRALSC